MKPGILLICGLLSVCSLRAQQKIAYSVTAGLNLSAASAVKSDMTFKGGPLPGFQLGGMAEIALAGKLSFRPGLLFSDEGTQKNLYGDETKFHVLYLKIPLDVIYHPGGKFSGGLGPYLGWALSGKYLWRGNSNKIVFGNNPDGDDLKHLDAGANLTAGYALQKNISLNAGFDLGLADISTQSNVKIRSRSFAITAAYLLKE